MLTPYLNKKLKERIHKLPSLQSELIKDAELLSNIGINSENDHTDFLYIMKCSPSLIKNLSNNILSNKELAQFSNIIYMARKEFPIDTIFNFHKAAENALTKMEIPIKKIAYPQGENFTDIKNSHDIQKWMKSMKDIYIFAQRSNIDLSKAFDAITLNWDKMEKQDFKSWLSFYEENAHNKYKTAQQYYSAGPGATIPMDHLIAKLPSAPNMQSFEQNSANEQTEAEKQRINKEMVEKKIKGIIGRLNAAERLATDPNVQRELQKRLDLPMSKWLEQLQGIKRLVQLAPMRVASSSILEDLIIRQANILRNQGFVKTAKELEKFAQQPAPDPAAPQTPPLGPPGAELNAEPNDGEEAMDALVENMNSEFGDSQNAIDSQDAVDSDDDPLASINVIAQALPPEPEAPLEETPLEVESPAPEETQAPSPEEVPEQNMEVEESAPQETVNPAADDLLEAALANVTIEDIRKRLETVANVFRTREIPRQLAIIDLMMDKLNMSSFFPSLAEASSKTLESNQYALTRLEDILSRIKGAVVSNEKELDLSGGNQAIEGQPVPAGVNTEQVKQNLAKQDDMEKVKKERRQAMEDAKAIEAVQPKQEETVTNVPEELAKPVNITPEAPPIAQAPIKPIRQ